MFSRVVKTLLALCLFFILFFVVALIIELYLPRKIPSEKFFFEVRKGKSIKAVARDLKEKNLIRQEWSFMAGYYLFFYPESLKAGEYALSPPLASKKILQDFTQGKVYLHTITIHEGLTAREISTFIEKLGFSSKEDLLAAILDTELVSSWDSQAKTLEGYLFPETYHFAKGTAAKEIVKTMVKQFKATFSEEWQRRASELKMTIREVVILASLIEKETSLPEERNLISAVFHNRLKQGMKLDCDPTVIYILKEKGIFNGNLRREDLKIDSSYNTYLHPGLPPGPICSPGKDSLEAALFPAPAGYLYFVSRNDGSHHFSANLEEHRRAVRKFQKRR